MDYNTICFFMFGVLFIGYLILEGFGYGVGMLLPFLGKSDPERQAIIQTLAPVWEGNEVWLIAAGAFFFAGFPNAYAAVFSGMYLALLLILASLVLRAVAFEFRDKETSKEWRNLWDWFIFAGSLVPALLWGVATANLLKGVPINGEMQYVGSFWDLISIYTLTNGLNFVLLFLVHGAIYLALRLDDTFANRMKEVGKSRFNYSLAVLLVLVVMSYITTSLGERTAPCLFLFMSILALYFAMRSFRSGDYLKSFILSNGTIAALTLGIFLGLYPRIVVSSLDPRWSLDIYNSASNLLTLKVMSITILCVLPLIVGFESWKYYVFRQKIRIADIVYGPQADVLVKMSQKLRKSIEHACCLADVMRNVIRALRSGDGHIISRLKPNNRDLLFGKAIKKTTRDNHSDDTEDKG